LFFALLKWAAASTKPAGLTCTRAKRWTHVAFEAVADLAGRLTHSGRQLHLMVSYLAYFWVPANSTVPRALIITAVVLSLTALNVFGVRQAASRATCSPSAS